MKNKIILKAIMFILITFLIIYYQRDIRIYYYDNKTIPEFKLPSNFGIVSDGKNYYLYRNTYNTIEYYNGLYSGVPKFWPIEIDKHPKKLVSEKHAIWVYYRDFHKTKVRFLGMRKVNK